MTAESGRSLDNEACVDPDDLIAEYDPGNADNCWTHSMIVGSTPKRSPDLLVGKSVSSTSTSPGADLTYTISIDNIGDADAKGPLTLTDTLPSTVTFVNANGANGWTCTESAGVVTCHEPGASGLAVGASASITIEVKVKDDASVPIVNTATAAPALVDPGPSTELENETAAHLANNTASVTSSVGGSGLDLAIASITDNPDPVNRAQPAHVHHRGRQRRHRRRHRRPHPRGRAAGRSDAHRRRRAPTASTAEPLGGTPRSTAWATCPPAEHGHHRELHRAAGRVRTT